MNLCVLVNNIQAPAIFCLGADITDYFNYGFTEDTWKQYCEKQRRLRMDLNMPKKSFVVRVVLFFFSVDVELEKVNDGLH